MYDCLCKDSLSVLLICLFYYCTSDLCVLNLWTSVLTYIHCVYSYFWYETFRGWFLRNCVKLVIWYQRVDSGWRCSVAVDNSLPIVLQFPVTQRHESISDLHIFTCRCGGWSSWVITKTFQFTIYVRELMLRQTSSWLNYKLLGR